jgi:hypothetical protein
MDMNLKEIIIYLDIKKKFFKIKEFKVINKAETLIFLIFALVKKIQKI